MFLEGLSPVLQELVRQPVAFLGGFCSGLLRVNLEDEPVKSWLANQGVVPPQTADASARKTSSPQSIDID